MKAVLIKPANKTPQKLLTALVPRGVSISVVKIKAPEIAGAFKSLLKFAHHFAGFHPFVKFFWC